MTTRRLSALLALALVAATSCAPGGAAKREAAREPDAVVHAAPTGPRSPPPAMLPENFVVGSSRCAPCHPAETEQWRTSSHSSTLRVATIEDEDRLASLIPCSDLTMTHALGGRHELRFLEERPDVAWGEGRWLALPCGWDVHENAMREHHVEGWRTKAFETSCAPCHVTLAQHDTSFVETSVGCEGCHGWGSIHADTARRESIFGFRGTAAQEVSTCGSCHLQGGVSRRTGRSFPDGYTPGGDLFEDYAFDWAALEHPAEGEAIDVHQKLLVKRVAIDGDASLRCTSCHQLHEMTHEKHAALPRQDYCLTCHQPDTFALKEYRQSCPVCEF